MIRLLAVCGLVMLSACDDTPLRVVTSATPLTITHPVAPTPVTMLPVQIRVINQGNLDAFIQELAQQQSTNNVVFMAMNTQDYEHLALNIADLRRYIQQQQQIIVYYRGITTPTP
jgi:hypothetical protein